MTGFAEGRLSQYGTGEMLLSERERERTRVSAQITRIKKYFVFFCGEDKASIFETWNPWQARDQPNLNKGLRKEGHAVEYNHHDVRRAFRSALKKRNCHVHDGHCECELTARIRGMAIHGLLLTQSSSAPRAWRENDCGQQTVTGVIMMPGWSPEVSV